MTGEMSIKPNELEELREAGLISPRQVAAIRHYLLAQRSSASEWLTLCLQLLSALLLVCGVGMLMAAHWEEWNNGAKLSIGAVMLASTVLGWYRWRVKKPRLAQGMALIGAGIWGADIIMCHTLYHWFEEGVEGALIFFLGIALIPFLTRQVVMVGVVAAGNVALWMAMCNKGNSPLNFGLSSDQTVIGLLLIGTFWWLLGEKWRNASGICRNYSWVSLPSAVAFICLIQASALFDREEPGMVNTLLCLTPLLLYALIKPEEHAWRWWMLSASGTCVAMLGMFSDIPGWKDSWCAALAVTACIFFAVAQMTAGIRCRRVAWVNYGMLMVLFAIFGVTRNVLESLETSGAVFIVCGLLLLPLVWLLERSRRTMVKLASRSGSSHS